MKPDVNETRLDASGAYSGVEKALRFDLTCGVDHQETEIELWLAFPTSPIGGQATSTPSHVS